jgi:hypothetical protein
MMNLKCCFKDNLGIPCGADVPSENDHSKGVEMTFIEFLTHGLCSPHASQMESSTRDPEALKYLFTSGEFDAPKLRTF